LKAIILCGDGYHLHKATQLIWHSKHEDEVVIQFLNARNEPAAEIHCQLVTVYANDMMVKWQTITASTPQWQAVTASKPQWQTVTASTPHKMHVQDTIIKT